MLTWLRGAFWSAPQIDQAGEVWYILQQTFKPVSCLHAAGSFDRIVETGGITRTEVHDENIEWVEIMMTSEHWNASGINDSLRGEGYATNDIPSCYILGTYFILLTWLSITTI